jgi:hypothetical protein
LFASASAFAAAGDFVRAPGSPKAITGSGSKQIAVGDFNNDGNADQAITSDFAGVVNILLGDGTGDFSSAPGSPVATGDNPAGVAVGKFNADANEDLVIVNQHADATILLGTGTGGFTAGAPPPGSFGGIGVEVADFNGDTEDDFATADGGAGTVRIHLGAGDGTFSLAATFTAATNSANSLAVGHFDANATADLAVANYASTNQLSIWLGNGDGTFSQAPGSPITTGPGGGWEVDVGDFNQDTKDDLALASDSDSSVAILLGSGAGTFAAAPTSPERDVSRPVALVVDDFDGDGRDDLATGNGNTANSISILLGQGSAGDLGPAATSPEPTGSIPWGLALGNFNGDARVDLVSGNDNSTALTLLGGMHELGVSTAGTGSGYVDSSPTGIDCGRNTSGHTGCTKSYADGTPVTLTAHPDANTVFTGFSGGGCSGSGLTCVVSVNQPQSVIATFTLKRPPAISSANHAAFSVGSAGSFTVTTTPGVPAATTLSRTGALPSGVTFVDNGNGTATLSGTPDAGTAGSYPLTITASNGVNPDATQSFTLTVNQAPGITSADHATFTVGTAGTFAVTTSGVPNPALSRTGPLPSGVTFVDNGNGTATLSGTPAAGTGGSFALSITANNGVSPNATQSFTLTVNQVPAITSADHTTFAVGSAGSFTVTTAAGFPTSRTLTKTGALPSGVTFVDNGDGTATLSGTPAAGTGGSYPLTITANNGVSPNATQSFTLTVNEGPAITADPSPQSADVGDTATFSASASGNPAPGVQWQRSTNGGATFTDIGGATNHSYSFTTAAGEDGDRYRAVFTNSVNSARTAAAALTLTPRTLSVSTAGNGKGTVTGPGVDCGAATTNDCAETVPDGDTIELTAHPTADSEFGGFSGGGCSTSPCTVSLDAAKSVTATVTLKRHQLSVTSSGAGTGAVSSDPAGVACPPACGADFDQGSTVTLTAHPAAGSGFAGFGGAGCSGIARTCTVTIGSGESVVDAAFTDATAPETLITHGPKNQRRAHTHFSFRSSEPGSSFACTLDDAAPEPCRSPHDYRDLKRGRHLFTVVATDTAGNVDPTPATARFKVTLKR